MNRLSRKILFNKLTLKRDAVAAILGHGSLSENQPTGVNSSSQHVHRQGRSPRSATYYSTDIFIFDGLDNGKDGC
jgi:hypothetical protein